MYAVYKRCARRPGKERHSLLGVICSRDYTGQNLLLLFLRCLQICLTAPKIQPYYISCKTFVRRGFGPAVRIQLTITLKGKSKHFEVCSSESLCIFVLLKFEMQKRNVKIFTEILSHFPGNSKLLFPN